MKRRLTMFSGFFSHRPRIRLALFLAWILASMLVAACGTATPAATPTPAAPTPTVTVAPAQDGARTQDGTPPPDGTATEEESSTDAADLSAEGVATAVSARTAVPTATPGVVDREISQFTARTGLAGSSFLGLTAEDWLNIGFSALILFAGYLAIRLLVRFSGWIVRRISPGVNEKLLRLIMGYSRWLLVTLLVGFAILRLEFLGDGLRTNSQDTLFIVVLAILTAFAFSGIHFVARNYVNGLESADDKRNLTPIIITAERLAQSVVLVVALSIILMHFGFDVSIIAALLIVFGLVISFGAQDILTDFISGFIILIDQPFRVGDSILIKELNTRGTVLEIGSRSTQIRTGDNREVIVPNSKIGQNQVINYSYPDSRFRAQTDIGVAYGTDPEEMRRVIERTVRGVEGVLPDKPVQVYYLKFGDSTRQVRVRWWIDTYRAEKPILDKVNTALELELDRAGIELPFNTYDLNLKLADKDSAQLEQVRQ